MMTIIAAKENQRHKKKIKKKGIFTEFNYWKPSFHEEKISSLEQN